MGTIMTASLAAACLVLSVASASAQQNTFSLSSVKGQYVFQVHGFYATAPTSNTRGDTGEIAALGLLSFDGAGHVSGTVNFTAADNNSAQATCQGSLSSASQYTVSATGTGGLTLSFTVASNCVVTPIPPTEGGLIFNLILNNNGPPPPATSASLLLSAYFPAQSNNPSIAGQIPVSLVLTGGLRRQGSLD